LAAFALKLFFLLSFLRWPEGIRDLILRFLQEGWRLVMSSKRARRKCRGCNEFFQPDYRNDHHQEYCQKADCRRASKAASQARWRGKSANRDYFRGPENTRRVQEWRKAHPGYWRQKSSVSNPGQSPAAQADSPEQSSCNVPAQSSRTLQDVCLLQDPVVIGLISMVTGSTLQEDIASTARKLQARGRDILGLGASVKTQTQTAHDYQTSDSS
jgi:hypothetical protein